MMDDINSAVVFKHKQNNNIIIATLQRLADGKR